MEHRQLPEDLRKRVRRFDQYKWVATRGVDEETILHGLPTDLRRDIQRHLCLDLVRRVWFSFILTDSFGIVWYIYQKARVRRVASKKMHTYIVGLFSVSSVCSQYASLLHHPFWPWYLAYVYCCQINTFLYRVNGNNIAEVSRFASLLPELSSNHFSYLNHHQLFI